MGARGKSVRAAAAAEGLAHHREPVVEGPVIEGPVIESVDWRALLAGGSPREILARLVDCDPLGLRAVVYERLRARAYLLEADRVFLRSLARVARYAPRYRGEPELAIWLAERVDEALLDLLDEDREGAALAEDTLAGLARPLGLDPAAMRAACARFHALPEEERRTFFALVVEGRDLDELARDSGESATGIARRARHALLTVILRTPPRKKP